MKEIFQLFPINIEVSRMLRKNSKFLIKKKVVLLAITLIKHFTSIPLELSGAKIKRKGLSWIAKLHLDLDNIELIINLQNPMKRQDCQLDILGQQQQGHTLTLLYTKAINKTQFKREQKVFSRQKSQLQVNMNVDPQLLL